MIHSKNNYGFTLVEVMIAMTFIGLVMTSVFVLQNSALRSIATWSRRVERFVLGVAFMAESRKEGEKEPTLDKQKIIENPKTRMQYRMIEVPKESTFKDMKDLYLERVNLTWQEGAQKKQDTFIMFHYRPEVKKS